MKFLRTLFALLVLFGIEQTSKPLVFMFPKPTGPYAVGTTSFHWIDKGRREIHSKDPDDYRELMVQVWYPAEGPKDLPVTLYASETVTMWKNMLGKEATPNVVASLVGLDKIYTHAVVGLPFSTIKQKYPVVIFSHGFGCTRNNNTAHCENLASHGYVVVGIDHTYSCEITRFPDGRQVEMAIKDYSLPEKIERRKECVADVCFVLDQLEKFNRCDSGSLLESKLDLDNVGMFGHSLGGIVTIQMCRCDSRIKSGISLDGPLFKLDETESFGKPFMFMLAETFAYMFLDEKVFEEIGITRNLFASYPSQLCSNLAKDAYRLVIQGSDHMSFCDYALMKKILATIFKTSDIEITTGSIDGYRMTEIVNSYLVAFFDKYLLGQLAPLLGVGVSPYDEVAIEQW